MLTDGSAAGNATAPRGWLRTTGRLSSSRSLTASAPRLLLLGACCFLLWCGLALLTSTSASAAEVNGDATHGTGLLDSGLLGAATGTLGTLTDQVAPDAGGRTGRPAAALGDESDRQTSDDSDAMLGSLTTSAVRSTGRSLAPVRAVVDPAGELVSTDLAQRPAAVQPVLLTAHRAGQTVLGGVATELGPLTRTVPLSASVPVALGSVTSHLEPVTGAVQPYDAVAGAAQYQAPTPVTNIRTDAEQYAAGQSGKAAAPYRGASLPAQPQDDHDGRPAGGTPAVPAGNTSPSNSHLGNGSGSAGSYAFAELPGMLAAWRPLAVVPTTDADISSSDEGRPSVSPD